jgi:hypothetical protein
MTDCVVLVSFFARKNPATKLTLLEVMTFGKIIKLKTS